MANWRWKRLWICRKADCGINECGVSIYNVKRKAILSAMSYHKRSLTLSITDLRFKLTTKKEQWLLMFVCQCIVSTIRNRWPTRCNYFGLFICTQSVPHVSGNVFAHHQEHLTVSTASDIVHLCCCRPVSWTRWNSFYLYPMSSTCFGRCFRPSSGALDCIHSFWYSPPMLLPAGVTEEMEREFHLVHNTSQQQHRWTISETVNTVKCSRWWAKTSPETCRAHWVQINKLKCCIFLVIHYEGTMTFILYIGPDFE